MREGDDPIPISALNHFAYCPRRCALVHVEQVWDENLYTLRGRMLHERADEPGGVREEGIRVERGLPLWSTRLGLTGKADVVEFHGAVPYPIEYKSGPRRQYENDDLQLCAQGLCLEEMTGKEVPRGAIYHYSSRRRREVIFTDVLRTHVAEAVEAIRRMLAESRLPPPVNDARCRHCSLVKSCLPSVVGERQRVMAVRASLFSVNDS